MTAVEHDDRSFLVDGRRIWLVSGEIHYFRVPSALWRDRLIKAKRCGLNCVSTYVAWNFHEAQEGRWDFTGDRDIVEFVRLAKSLGLYVILRPGPYICAEWDFGGLPAWLTTKTGVAYRTSNAVFTHYFDKYFRQLLPRLAEHQVTRGGNIILIQNENEYQFTTMPDRVNYLEFISQLFRRSGFDIPIISCNFLSEPLAPGAIDCVNAYEKALPELKRFRARQSGVPLLVTEFYSGWFDQWGLKDHHRRDARDVARRALEMLGAGAQVNYYVWHGGTNFGFWGSRLARSDSSFQTTSYDYDAPLAEGGGLTEKYYLTRLVNTLAGQMGHSFAACAAEGPGVSSMDIPDVLNMAGPSGRWAVITGNGMRGVNKATVALPDGRELDVSLEPLGAAALPFRVPLGPGHRLDYSNLMPLGLFGNSLVLHGPPGWPARIGVDGRNYASVVGESHEPVVIDCDGVRLVIVNSSTASRTWWVDDHLIMGPEYVGATPDDVVADPAMRQYAVITPENELAHRKVKHPVQHQKASAPPRLGAWHCLGSCDEPGGDNVEWQKLDRPRDADQLGVHYGYLWYRTAFRQDRPGRRRLFLPDCQDRAHLFLNGKRVGLWGSGDQAVQTQITVELKRGQNELVVLTDNMGRYCVGPHFGEKKGLFGHIYDAKPLALGKFKLTGMEQLPRRQIPRGLTHLAVKLESMPCWSAEANLALARVSPIHISLAGLPYNAALFCNDHMAGFFDKWSDRPNYGRMTLNSELRKGKNIIRLVLWGDVQPRDLELVKMYTLLEPLTAGAVWGFRPWQGPPTRHGKAVKGMPAWFKAGFAYDGGEHALFVKLAGCAKGQLFLNGHNIGRFWQTGPQSRYYLPDCWLKAENELVIFEEHGSTPSGSRLEFRREPFGDDAD